MDLEAELVGRACLHVPGSENSLAAVPGLVGVHWLVGHACGPYFKRDRTALAGGRVSYVKCEYCMG